MVDRRTVVPETPQERIRKIAIAISQNEQIIKSEKPGSARFKTAQKALEELRKAFNDANNELTAERNKVKKAAAEKAKAKAEEDLARAEALNDTKAAGKARDKIRAADDAAAAASPDPTLKKDTTPADSDGDGIPNTLDKNPNTFDKPAPKPKPKPTTPTPTPAPTPTTPGQDIKDLWVSYLRTTFASLEDKTQKAEIDILLKRAKDEKWDEDTFMDALEGTVWWQATYPSIRSFFLDTHDPRKASTFAERVSNTMDTMLGKLEALGVTVRQIDPATGKVIDNTDFVKGIALKSIENNWDDDQLEQYLSTQSSVLFSGGGTLGSFYDRIAQQAYLYGVPLDETMKKTINTSLLDPLDGRDANYWIKTVKDMAYDAPQNKPFLASLQAGRNLYEVTNSYRTQMANLLEVDSTAITWNDLMGKVVDNSTGNARTFADFTKQLKTDPLWQYTRNAKETYSNTALDIAKMFGFMG
jgi:Sec-independent protein translocase protein TatA